jgi:hypothetical protein
VSRIGITGHSTLTTETARLVADALHDVLAPQADHGLVGISCLARGADQLFAQAVLDLGGTLEVVLPSADYRRHKVKADNAATFDELLSRASAVCTLPFVTSNREAYLAANEHMLTIVDVVVAVWDGEPAERPGSTGDVVELAHSLSLPVTVVWPGGAERERQPAH